MALLQRSFATPWSDLCIISQIGDECLRRLQRDWQVYRGICPNWTPAAAFCERDPFARAMLTRASPAVPADCDIAEPSAARFRLNAVPRANIHCVGFPSQDFSVAGGGSLLPGEQSAPWSHMLRLVQECRPDWVAAALRVRGADRIMPGLKAPGYACSPLLVGIAHVGASDGRSRVFILVRAERAELEDRLRLAAFTPPGLPAKRRRGWSAEPGMGRVADGVTRRVALIRALGNAVLPDNTGMIGQAFVRLQAAADLTRSENTLRNLATFGPTMARQYPAFGLRSKYASCSGSAR